MYGIEKVKSQNCITLLGCCSKGETYLSINMRWNTTGLLHIVFRIISGSVLDRWDTDNRLQKKQTDRKDENCMAEEIYVSRLWICESLVVAWSWTDMNIKSLLHSEWSYCILTMLTTDSLRFVFKIEVVEAQGNPFLFFFKLEMNLQLDRSDIVSVSGYNFEASSLELREFFKQFHHTRDRGVFPKSYFDLSVLPIHRFFLY